MPTALCRPGIAEDLGDLGALLKGQLQRVLPGGQHHADVVELRRQVAD